MRSFSLVFIILVFLVFFIVGFSVIYFFLYTRKINQRLKEGVYEGRRLWTPQKVVLCLVIAVLVILCIVPLSRLITGDKDTPVIDDAYYQAEYMHEVYTPEEMQEGYLQQYSIDENPGYEKTIEQVGDVKFTYFISEQSYDRMHPAFIVYVQYTGNEPVEVYDYMVQFLTTEYQNLWGNGSGGADTSDYICIMGNASINCIVEVYAGYYQEKEYAERSDEDELTPTGEKIQILLNHAAAEE